jgi:hypothetical protein
MGDVIRSGELTQERGVWGGGQVLDLKSGIVVKQALLLQLWCKIASSYRHIRFRRPTHLFPSPPHHPRHHHPFPAVQPERSLHGA